jgi:putative phosphoesterase
MPPLKHRRVTVPIPASGALRLVAISDTHGRPHAAVTDLVRRLAPDAILHAGDVGSPSIVDEVGAIAPVVAVRGNVDSRALGLPDVATVVLTERDRPRFVIVLVHVGLAGTKLHREIRTLVTDRDAQLVVCGHSHLPWIGLDGTIAVLNPGSCGPRRFAYPITIGVVDVAPSGVDLHHVDCETGERWAP